MRVSISQHGNEVRKVSKPVDTRNYIEKLVDQHQITGSLMFTDGIRSYLRALIGKFDMPQRIDPDLGYGTVDELPTWFRNPDYQPYEMKPEINDVFGPPMKHPETLREFIQKTVEGIIAITEYYSIK